MGSEDEMDCGNLDDDCAFGPGRPLPSGVKKEVLTEAPKDAWKRPKAGDAVTVHYEGTLEDGSKFDSSRERGAPVTFTVGKGEVIKGWDAAVPTMRKGEVAKITIAPEFAYGDAGQPPTIPPKAVLIFEVELISWVAKDDLFGDDGAILSTLKDATGWKHPSNGEEIRMSLKVTSEAGAVVEDRRSFDYVMGSEALGCLRTVVEKALKSMSQGQQCSVKCAKDYVYEASQGHGAVTIELELEDIYEITDASILKDETVWHKCISAPEGYERASDNCEVTLKVEDVTDGEKTLPGFSGPATLTFVLGCGEVCDSLEGAAREMKKGEVARITCTVPWKAKEPRLGLGEVDAPRVVFHCELTDCEKGPEQWKLTTADKWRMANERKELGGLLFKAKRFELALDRYKKVQELLSQAEKLSDRDKALVEDLKRVAELNKAECHLQLNDPTGALAVCNSILQTDRNNEKALFRKGRAHAGRAEYEEAVRSMERVLEVNPGNAAAKNLIPQYQRAARQADKKSQSTFAKMCEGFGKIGSGRDKKPEPEKAEEPEEPEDPMKKELVSVTFRINKPGLEQGESVFVVGAAEALGAWDNGKAVAMGWVPPEPDLQAMASGRPQPKSYAWQVLVDIPQSEGKVEYKYAVRGAGGEFRLEEGDVHKIQLSGMGNSRMRARDEWRSAPRPPSDDES